MSLTSVSSCSSSLPSSRWRCSSNSWPCLPAVTSGSDFLLVTTMTTHNFYQNVSDACLLRYRCPGTSSTAWWFSSVSSNSQLPTSQQHLLWSVTQKYLLSWPNLSPRSLLACFLISLIVSSPRSSTVSSLVLSCLQLRLLRLARWWPTLHIFLKIMWGCFSILWRLTLILVVLFFTFSVVGLQLYQDDLRLLPSAPIFRWHMGDFFHSCLVVFRVLCGDLVEPLWDCMKVSGQSTCPIFFLSLIVIGRLLVSLCLNLYSVSLCLIASVLNTVPLLFQVLVLFVSLLLIPLQNNRTSSKGNETKLTINWIKSLFGKKDTPGDADAKCTWFSHYSRFYRSGDSPWSKFRRCCLFLVEHKVFEVFMIVTIVLSSVALVIHTHTHCH